MDKTVFSFDADGCLLNNESVQQLCLHLSKQPNTVCILLTSRRHDLWGNRPEFTEFVKRFGISEINFTDGNPKVNFFTKLQIDCHFDDDLFEIELINECYLNRAFWTDYYETANA